MSYQYTKNPQTGESELVIMGWEDGLGESPYNGLGDMRNVDNNTIPGEISVAMKTEASNTNIALSNISFTTTSTIIPVSIGDTFQGGKVAYILQAGDPGYVNDGIQRGFIVRTAPISSGVYWHAVDSTTVTTSTALGQGQANTTAIITAYGAEVNAAKTCDNYTVGSYSDWYLPSKDELNKIYLNRVVLGIPNNAYWSSTEFSASQAYAQSFSNGFQGGINKSSAQPILAVRSFVNNASYNTYNWVGGTTIPAGTPIYFTGNDLPNGLTAGIAYYVLSSTATSFTVSDNFEGFIVTSTDAGTGAMSFSIINPGTPIDIKSGIFPFAGVDINKPFYFLLDDNGRIWVWQLSYSGGTARWVYLRNLSNETSLITSGNIIVWKGYLFWFETTNIWCDKLASIEDMSNNWLLWQTDLISSIHSAIVSINKDAVYFCNDRYIGSIKLALNATDFVPFSGTFTNATGITFINDVEISTATAFFNNSQIGYGISGTGIPGGATIESVSNDANATISAPATANGTGITFTITVPNTYNYNSKALDLPSNDYSTCLAELGSQLLVGGINNYIYPWDFASPSFNTPIPLSENYTTKMVTVNTTTYIFCGSKGRIYITNGANANLYWEVPDFLSETVNPYFIWTDAVFNRNQLYFGFKVTTNSGTTIDKYGGVWSIDLDKGVGVGKLQNQLSYATYAGYVSALCAYRGISYFTPPNGDGYALFIGWNNGSIGGIDKTISTPYSNGEAYIVSDMLPVGQFLTKKTFSNVEFKLATPLVTGESVTFSYRTNITEAFTSLPITQGGTVGELSGIATMNFQGVQWLQIKTILTSTATNPSYVRLQRVTIR